MARSPEALQDEAAIRDLIARYAHHVDDRSVADILQCFSDGSRFDAADGSLHAEGLEAIGQFFESAFAGPRLAPPAESTHLMANTVVDVQGDVAHAETQAVAFLASGAEGLVTRGLRYSDELVRTASGWRIAHRVHRCVWEATDGGRLVRTEGV
jgi:ketosteroid isomerase-like protein